MTHNFQTLRRVVVNASRASHWDQAVLEWQVMGVKEDPASSGTCVCGKRGLRYLYEIYNRQTTHTLLPIGSSCVEMFGLDELDMSVAELRRLFDLRSAYESHRWVPFTSDFFSRATLTDLWENDAFPPNRFNGQNGKNDYRFLMRMFNMRRAPTDGENRKIRALLYTIRDFVLSDDRLK